MTGKELFFEYQDNSTTEYADLLMTIYLAIGERLFPILIKANKESKKLAVSPYNIDSIIRDITESDIVLI